MRSKLVIVALMLITTFIGFGIIIPVLPQAVTDIDPGSAKLHTGLMLSLYSLVSFLLSPFWGSLSGRIGRRPVIMIGVLGFCLSFLLFGLAVDNLVLMYVSRLLGGLFSGAVTACIVAYVADITTNEERTKGMAVVGMSIGLGFTFGPFVGGELSRISLAAPFFAAAGLALVTFFAAWLKLSESLPPEKRAEVAARPKVSRWTAFQGPLKNLYVLAFFVTFSLAILEATMQLYGMERFDATPRNVGYMFFFCGLAGALVQGGVVRRRVKKGQEGGYIAAGLVISAAGFFLLLTANHWVTATVYLCIFGIGNSLIRPCVTSLITQKTTVEQGVASGLSSSMDSLGRIVGPLLGSLLLGVYDALPFIVSGALSLAALGLLARFRSADRAFGRVQG
ncbi:tetracycline resistance MFS efflux pump [Cohnella xylanilytica]|uniref:MFS transporter n=1 Tax=Cohnella xylanilytica TaxID=557555 RepID=A0A841TXT9_9BACL|nr:MFS transporter [Cohnella xylanilytica]MBB6693035.1 MFS transporter [Cohnella xylanilytica]GIO15585.1 tetracycline resistance MFS efflux pump [Cohnella xylanilytica]